MNDLIEKIKLDFRSDEPLYLQIAHQVEQLVAAGELALGDQLPTVRELAAELRVNFNTVSRAYRVLDESRLISTQRGRGTYIWEEPDPGAIQTLRRKTLEELAAAYLERAQQMGCTPAEALTALEDAVKTSKGNENQ